MLFSSYEFILFYLPVVLGVYYLCARHRWRQISLLWLVVASLFFYAWWKPQYLVLIAFSISFNYLAGSSIRTLVNRTTRKVALAAAISLNLAMLGYFKYAGFALGIANSVAGVYDPIPAIVLPLAISFFTFTQIAYLVDVYKGKTQGAGLLEYGLFVSFFPHLIAGPIVHYSQIMPQFSKRLHFSHADFSVGLTIFLIGLFSKVLLADPIGQVANLVFEAASNGTRLTLIEAWWGAVAYALQIYFDFSGYSDMAIGLARMFGIKFPINFNSPYKATSIIDFWGRWHITLSSFLREYLYIPLGGNRKGKPRRYINLMITMVLGGLWHGAGWTFVFWGTLHGLYLVINHVWRALRGKTAPEPQHSLLSTVIGRLVTLGAVTVAWVFFRASDWESAMVVLRGMAGINGVVVPESIAPGLVQRLEPFLHAAGISVGSMAIGSIGVSGELLLLSVLMILLACFAPNTQEIMVRYDPASGVVGGQNRLKLSPRVSVGLLLGVLLFLVFRSYFSLAPTTFIYFNF